MLANIFPLHRFAGYSLVDLHDTGICDLLRYASRVHDDTDVYYLIDTACNRVHDSVGYKLRINKNVDFQTLRKTLVFVRARSASG